MTTQRNYWVNRTTKQVIYDASTGEMHRRYPVDFPVDTGIPASNAAWIFAPDLSAVEGESNKYWEINGDTVLLVDQATRNAIDLAELEASRDASAAQLDEQEDILRAFMLLVLDELNGHAQTLNAILDASDNAANLAQFKTAMTAIQDYPERTAQQLRNAIRGKLGM